MPENFFGIIALSVWILFLIVMAVEFIRSRFGPVKTVKATLIAKNTIDSFSRYSGNGKRTKYELVFSAGRKKLSFYVNEFSYSGYRVNETGTLKYQGKRLIDFH